MGIRLFDQYTFLHYACGVVVYFFGVSLDKWMMLHTLFEISENTAYGVRFINTYLANIWPGGKPQSDSVVNIVGDSVGTLMGWLSAMVLDQLGDKLGWYERHI